MNAAELDRRITAERAYNAVIDRGGTEAEAKSAAEDALKKKQEEQLLRRLGIS